jgi:DNA primase
MNELTPDERDALTEDELVEFDLQHVERDPRLSEAALRQHLRARVHRERSERAQDRADRDMAEKAGTTMEALHVARAERAERERQEDRQRDLDRARDAINIAAPAVEPNAPRSPKRQRGRPKGTRTVPKHQIVSTFRILTASYGRHPTEDELCANLKPRIGKRTLQDHLKDYGLGWPIE